MKKYILSILVLVTVILAAVGCSSHSGFGGAVNNNGPIPQNITVNKNGGIAPQEPFPGFKLQCDDGTFASNEDIELIIIEEPAGSAGGTSLLKSSSGIYSVRAIKTSTKEEVNTVFKPIKITLHNSSASDEVFIGITTDREGIKWNYVPYNGPVAGALRLSSNIEVEITYDMFKLGCKIGLFAPEEGKTVSDLPVVSYLNIGDKDNEISVKDNVYTENLVLNLVLTGANLSKADMNKDCIVRISYPVSDKNAEKLKVIGGTANTSDSESKSGATGNAYVRSIEITGLTEVAQPLGGQLGAALTLALNGLSTSVFPKNFNIEVINTDDSENFRELPFSVTTSVELKEKASPSTSVPVPTNVAASYNAESKVISVDWEWEGTDENVKFEVSLLNTSLDGATPNTFSVGNVRSWNSSGVDLAFLSGDYSVSVVAISNGEKSEPAQKAQAFTVAEAAPDTLSAPVITALSTEPYAYGTDVTVEWSASELTSPNGNTGTVNYAVYIDTNTEPATEIAKDLTATSCTISAADLLKTAGKYYVKVVASCNDLTADSTTVEAFEVAEAAPDTLSAPVITALSTEPYAYGTDVTVEWSASELTSPKGNTGTVNYAVYMDINTEPATEIAKDLTATSYTISAADLLKTAGKYYVKVVASCNDLTADSTTVEAFEVAEVVVETPKIIDPSESPLTIALGDKTTIWWDECDNALSYNVYVYTGSDVPTTPSATVNSETIYYEASFEAAGTYNVVVEAVNGEVKAKSGVKEISVVDITPKNVQATGIGLCLASSWEAGSDISGITYYVSVKDVSEDEVVISSYTSELSCNIEDCLPRADTYIFEVSAKIGSSYSASATVNFTATWWAGEGTVNSPYLVTSALQLDKVRNRLNVENVYFKQTRDIDLTDYIATNYPDSGWSPIGESYSRPFMGSYDGGNKKISGLRINRTSSNYVGLFGYSKSNNGSFHNIIIIEPTIKGNTCVGALVGDSGNDICQCCVIGGNVEGTESCGLLVGWPMCHLDQCFTSDGSVKASAGAGGLVGFANSLSNCQITNCYSRDVTITCNNNSAGLFGNIADANFEISNSYSANTVNCSGSKGAFVYSYKELTKMKNCFTTEEGTLRSGCVKVSKYIETYYDWDSDIWNLNKDLPTLRWYDNLSN